MFGIVNSNPIRLQTIQELITTALSNYLQKSGGEVTGPITGSNGTSSVDLTNGINVTKTGDAESQELGGTITDSVHTTYYGLQLDSTDEATDDYSSVKITPEYVQTNSGATTYEKLASDSYDLEVGNQQIIHYDATNGLQLSNVATPVSSSDVSTKGYTDSTIDSKISDALSSGGAIDDAIDNAISNLGDTYLPKSGGTMTGNLTLVGSPSTDNMAATKKYVDDSIIASGGVVVDTQISSTSENPVQNKVIKSALDEKVDIVQGKGLSTNDYTDADKQKLSGIDAGAEVNILEGVNVNGSASAIVNKVVDITVPTKTSELTNDSGFITTSDIPEGAAASTTSPLMDGVVSIGTELAFARGDHRHPTDTSRAAVVHTHSISEVNGLQSILDGKAATSDIPTDVSELTNDSGYQTASDVTSAISSAIAGITGISFEVVQALPQTGEAGVIYLISNSGSAPNIYDEYIYVNNSFEKIGTTEIDLSNYLQMSGGTMTGALTLAADPTSDLQASTKQYVDTAVSTAAADKVNKPVVIKSTLAASGWGNQKTIELRNPSGSGVPDLSTLASSIISVSEESSGYKVVMNNNALASLIQAESNGSWEYLTSYDPAQEGSNYYVGLPAGTKLRINNSGSSDVTGYIFETQYSVAGGGTQTITDNLSFQIMITYSSGNNVDVTVDTANTFVPLSTFDSSTTSDGVTYTVPNGCALKITNPTSNEFILRSTSGNIYGVNANGGVQYVQRYTDSDLYFKFFDSYDGLGTTLFYEPPSGTAGTATVYSFESLYPSSQYDLSVEPNGAAITSEQYEAWGAAQIVGNPDSNMIKALGTVPTVDIPVVLTVTEKQ